MEYNRLILERFIIAYLGAVAKLRKATVSFAMSACLSVRLFAWNNSAPTGRIFMKFDSGVCFEKLLRNSSFIKIGQE